MKVCYCDESGTGGQPIAVMAGVIVDSQRMHITKADWQALLSTLSALVGRPIREIHTRDFYSGSGIWGKLDGPIRAQAISEVASWIVERKHRIVFSAVNRAEFEAAVAAGKIKPEVASLWRFLGMHILLAVQKELQKEAGTKGHTLFVFDEEKRETLAFPELVSVPPGWSDTYYSRSKKQDALSHIVDVPYFADSRHVALIQVADFVAFFIRRHLDIVEGHEAERYTGEAAKLQAWSKVIANRFISSASLYPSTKRCECAQMFFEYAPASARRLCRGGT